jgi:glycosyl transferase family 25
MAAHRAAGVGIWRGCDLAPLFDYFDRISIVHLPERTDRLALLTPELSRAGLDIKDPKVFIPHAPKPESANGFQSPGVYGNFLSHLGIIEQAYADNLDNVLILEDDAMFRLSFRSRQRIIADHLRANEWDTVFLGHSIERGLPKSISGLARFTGAFVWSHCYGIRRSIMPRIIEYFHRTLDREASHPDGGRMYIDGAHTEFRRLNPDAICLVASPCLSAQRGSPSGLGTSRWYDRHQVIKTTIATARATRDSLWRLGLITIGPKSSLQLTRIDSANPWP